MRDIKCSPLIHLCFSLVLILLQLEKGECVAVVHWCCRGWSDDVAALNVDTKDCQGLCAGYTFCTNSTNKDCATNWDCGNDVSNGSPNKTDEDCSKPAPGNACFCDTPWCNCPGSLKKKESPSHNKLVACDGEKSKPKGIQLKTCGLVWHEPIVYPENDDTYYRCERPTRYRLRADCFGFTSPKKYDYGSDSCRCTTDYCNCPPEIKKQNAKTGAHQTVSSFSFKTQLAFLFALFYVFKI